MNGMIVIFAIIFLLIPWPLFSSEWQAELAFPKLVFHQPVDLQTPRDGTNRLFVVERKGRIWVFPNNQDMSKTNLFLDIQTKVNSHEEEEGLLGLAFHPEFFKNGFIYLNYTSKSLKKILISRYQVDPKNPNQVNHQSEQKILEIDQPFGNHNAGQIAFGSDGFLYVGTGDGGAAGDPFNYAQNKKSLLGKMLRIDVNKGTNEKPYAIPLDNPYLGNQRGYREEIYAYGFRNPRRFSFDPLNRHLWLADVGQDKMEEINLVSIEKNYGWSKMEGSQCFKPPIFCKKEGLTPPLWEYTHEWGQSITGGYVYQGKKFPSLKNVYIYGDFVSGRVWGLREQNEKFKNELLLETNFSISSFGLDSKNELYFFNYLDGKIYQLKNIPKKNPE